MQPHDLLLAYLSKLEDSVNQLPAYAEKYIEEILTPERVNVRLRLRFDNGKLLEINEALVIENDALQTLGYRYHLQDANGRLLFRYDDTPHFPELDTFPHHKHVLDDVIRHEKPDLLNVLKEAGESDE